MPPVMKDVIKRLKQIYLSVDDIDLFTGGLREAASNSLYLNNFGKSM
jgi:hypothetical protein